jgi:hypothetical protein
MTLISKKIQIIFVITCILLLGYIFVRHSSLDYNASDLQSIYNAGHNKVSIVSSKGEVALDKSNIERVIAAAINMESKWFVDPKGSAHSCSLNFSSPEFSETYSIQFYRKGSVIITKATVVDGASTYYFGFYYGKSLYSLVSEYAPNICENS